MAARANKSRRTVYASRAKKSRRVDLAAGADTFGQVEPICLEGRLGHWSRYEWTWLPVDKSRLAISADKSGCVNLATGVKMSRWVDWPPESIGLHGSTSLPEPIRLDALTWQP